MAKGKNVYICRKKMFSELSLEGVNCTYIADAEVTYYVNEVDCVLTGA